MRTIRNIVLTVVLAGNLSGCALALHEYRQFAKQEVAGLVESEAKEPAPVPANVAILPSVPADRLDYSYTIKGAQDRFAPTRVFNDGTRVFLQMPEEIKSAEAVVLLLLDTDDTPHLANYRVSGTQYVVDQLFDKAMVLVGADGSESKFTITWTKAPKKQTSSKRRKS